MSRQPKTIWITRAEPGASATAARVAEMGHATLVSPLLHVQPIEDASIDLRGVGALAFTSANGVRAFCALTSDRSLQVFAVGSATAKAARAQGFKRVLSADGDVAALAQGIAVRGAEIAGLILHPCATEPAGDLTGALASVRVEARALPLYETVEVAPPAEVLNRLARLDAVLLHSPKAARILARLLERHPAPDLRALCLSAAVADPLAQAGHTSVTAAAFPFEAALLNLIDRPA